MCEVSQKAQCASLSKGRIKIALADPFENTSSIISLKSLSDVRKGNKMDEVQGRGGHQAPPQTQRDRTRRQVRTFRLLLILPFAATAILLAPLAILKKGSEVEVSLKVSRVSFVIGELSTASLFNSVRTVSLSLLNFQKVELGPGVLEIATAIDPNTDAPSAWRGKGAKAETLIISRDDFASVTLEDVRLNQLDIKPGSVITLSSVENEPNSLKLHVDGADATGSIAVARTLLLSCNYCEASGLPVQYDFDSKLLRFTSSRKHVITFSGRSEATTVALELPPGTKLVEQNFYLERDVNFTQLEGRSRTSTIIGEGGKITFEELKKKEVKVGVGDFVILDDLEDFFIKTLQIDNGINITLHGRVGELATGPRGFVKNRLPSLLEWLYAREMWALYLNALILISTTALAILKRLRTVREEE